MKRPLFMIAGGFVLGEVLGLRERSAYVCILAAVFTAAVLCVLISDHGGPSGGNDERPPHKNPMKKPWVFGLLFLFVLSGFLRGNAERKTVEREAGLRLDGVRAEVCGRVESIRETAESTELLIRPESGISGQPDLRYLLVYLDGGYREDAGGISIGMSVMAGGRYSLFGSASNPGQFDFGGYYRARKLSYRFFADDIEILSRRQSLYDKWREFLRRLSLRSAMILDQCADEQDSGILRSMLLGDKAGLDPQISGLYRKSGISHLLAISGLHLSLISAAVYGILKRTGMGFGLSGLLGGLVLFSYCIMSGASLSSQRALIMVLLSYLAAWKGRTYDLLTSLGVAAFLLFFDSPYQLTQPGPLLSFLAILGIAAVSAGSEGAGRIFKMLRPSIGVQMAAAPVILSNFFRFPIYGFILNLFVLPLTGFVVASGAIGILAGTVSLPLGRFFLGPAHYILLWYDLLCRFFGALPFSDLLLGRPTPVQTGIYYAALLMIWFRGKKNGEVKRLLHVLPLLLLLFPLPVRGCSVLFMDVGQGDGILIRTEAGVVLVDGGSSSVKDLSGERLVPCLESLAVPAIDIAIVSHGHADHISGLSELLSPDSQIRVKNLILPAAGKGDEIYDDLTELAKNAGTNAFWMKTGDALELGKMRITCLYPDDSGGLPAGDENEHSLVLRFDYGGFSMLAGGDMTSNGEAVILSDPSNAGALSGIQVLKVAHHGSFTSSSGEWLDVLAPSWAVVSYGMNNIYGHPAAETVEALEERGITLFETAKDGAVSLWTDGKKIRWDTFIPRE